MENDFAEIDFSALVYGDIITTEEALKDVPTFEFPEEVLNGTTQVVFTSSMQCETI